MPIPENYRDLMGRLFSKSEKAQANWRELPQADAFYVSVGEFAITTQLLSNLDRDIYGVRIELLNVDGESIDAFEVDSRDPEDLRKLRELHDMARRKARRIDEAIERLTAALDKEGDVGIGTTLPNGDDEDTPITDDDIPF